MLFHVQMQMTISSLERVGLCSHLNGEQRGTEALEEHLARAVRMNYGVLKLSLNSKSGQCSTEGAETSGREMFPSLPTAVPVPHPTARPRGLALLGPKLVPLPPGVLSPIYSKHLLLE